MQTHASRMPGLTFPINIVTKVKQFSKLLKQKEKKIAVTLLAAISLKDMLMAALKAKSCP